MDDLSQLNTELGTIFTWHLSAMSYHKPLEQVSHTLAEYRHTI